MRRFATIFLAACAVGGIAVRADAAQLTFTVTVGTVSCGGAGLAVPPSAPVSGEIDSDTAGTTKISDLGLGCLYFGGGDATVIAGGQEPDGSTSVLDVAAPAGPQACAATKLKAAGSKTSCALKLESGESKKGIEEDETKLGACGSKMFAAFDKAEAKSSCLIGGDKAAIGAKVDAFVDDVTSTIVGGAEPPPVSACDAAQIKAAGSNAACRLKLEAGAAKKGTSADPTKVTACGTKMSAAFDKAETKPPCTNPGQKAAIEAEVEAFVADVKNALLPNLVGGAGTGADDCLVGAGPATHCVNNNSMPSCSSDVDCAGAAGACALDANCFFGPPLPILSPPPFGSLTTCVLNAVQKTAAGSGDTSLGSYAINLPLSSRVYITGNTGSPCPRCLSGSCDPTWKTNTALPSPDSGSLCTAVGTRQTSNSCRPALGGFQAPLPVNLSPLTTGTVASTAASGFFCPGQNNPGAFGQATAQRIQETGLNGGDLSDNAPHTAHVVSVFCVPATGNAAVDGVADLPGPGGFSQKGVIQLNP